MVNLLLLYLNDHLVEHIVNLRESDLLSHQIFPIHYEIVIVVVVVPVAAVDAVVVEPELVPVDVFAGQVVVDALVIAVLVVDAVAVVVDISLVDCILIFHPKYMPTCIQLTNHAQIHLINIMIETNDELPIFATTNKSIKKKMHNSKQIHKYDRLYIHDQKEDYFLNIL